MNSISRIGLIALVSVISCSAAAKKITYSESLASISKIEKDLRDCAISPTESLECYFDAEKQYNQKITDIRKNHGDRVNLKLWQTINLGFKKQADLCRSDFMLSGETQFFPLYRDCVARNLHSLAITAVELHLK